MHVEQPTWGELRNELCQYMRKCMTDETLSGEDAVGLISAISYCDAKAQGLSDIELLGGGYHA